MSATHASLGAAADERKARLSKLKSLKRKAPSDETLPPESTRSPSPPTNIARLHLSGRNYDAETRGPKLGFEAPPTVALDKPTLEQQAQAIEEEIRDKERAEAAKGEESVDLFKLQPKKPNWDLKRDLERKLEVLGVRTDNAIALLVRERIEGAKQVGKAASGAVANGDGDGAEVGMEGVALVEGLREREREDEEDMRREKEDEDLV